MMHTGVNDLVDGAFGHIRNTLLNVNSHLKSVSIDATLERDLRSDFVSAVIADG